LTPCGGEGRGYGKNRPGFISPGPYRTIKNINIKLRTIPVMYRTGTCIIRTKIQTSTSRGILFLMWGIFWLRTEKLGMDLSLNSDGIQIDLGTGSGLTGPIPEETFFDVM
jgi:hypothetical protein